jgi:hypothetical protein
VDRGRFLCPGPQPTGHPLRGHHPAVRTASPGGRRSPRHLGHPGSVRRRRPVPLLQSAGMHGWSATGGRGVPVVLRGSAGSAVDAGRPTSTRPHRGHCRGVRFRGHLLGSAPGPCRRRTATVRTLGHWTRLVDTGRRPALWTPATAAALCGPCGNATLDSRQHSRPPPRDVRPGAGPQGAAAASTRHGLTASSVAWCSTSIWSAPDGFRLLTLDVSSAQTALDGSRRIVWMINRMINHGAARLGS